MLNHQPIHFLLVKEQGTQQPEAGFLWKRLLWVTTVHHEQTSLCWKEAQTDRASDDGKHMEQPALFPPTEAGGSLPPGAFSCKP